MGARVKSIKIEHQADVYREEANNFWSDMGKRFRLGTQRSKQTDILLKLQPATGHLFSDINGGSRTQTSVV